MNFGGEVITKEKNLIATKYLYINSYNRDSGTNDDFVVYFPPTLFVNNDYSKKKFLKISLYSMTINREWYNVLSGINNTVQYSPDGIASSYITIPEGSYSVYELLTALNTLLIGMTLTYSLLTNKYTFTPVNPNAWINPTTCGSFLGLDNGTTYNGTFTSTYPVNMLYESDIYLNSDLSQSSHNLDNVNNLKIQTSTIIEKIPITVPPFGNVIFNANELHSSTEIQIITHLTSARFWLSTNRLRRLTGLNNPWSFTLKLDVYQE